MSEFAFHRALAAIWEFIGAVNRYVDTTQPWALAKQPDERARLEHGAVRAGGVAAPARHRAGARSCRTPPRRSARALGQTGEPRLADATWGGLAAGTPRHEGVRACSRASTTRSAPRRRERPAVDGPPAPMPRRASSIDDSARSSSAWRRSWRARPCRSRRSC